MIDKIDMIILCGESSTRIQSVLSGKSKALAALGGKVHLDIFLEFFKKIRFSKINSWHRSSWG